MSDAPVPLTLAGYRGPYKPRPYDPYIRVPERDILRGGYKARGDGKSKTVMKHCPECGEESLMRPTQTLCSRRCAGRAAIRPVVEARQAEARRR